MSNFIRSFIPNAFAPRTDARRRARILVDTSFIVAFIALVHAVIYGVVYGSSWHLGIAIIFIANSIAAPFILRASGSLTIAGHSFATGMGCVFTGLFILETV